MGRRQPGAESQVETFSSSSHAFRRLQPFLEGQRMDGLGPVPLDDLNEGSRANNHDRSVNFAAETPWSTV